MWFFSKQIFDFASHRLELFILRHRNNNNTVEREIKPKKNKLLIITASTFNAYLVFMHTFESIMRSLTAVSNKRQAREAIMQSRAVFNLNNFEKGL